MPIFQLKIFKDSKSQKCELQGGPPGLDIAKKNSRVTKEGKPVIKSQTRKLFDFQSPNIRDGATASTKALGPTHFNPLADGRIKMGKQLFVELKLPRNQTSGDFDNEVPFPGASEVTPLHILISTSSPHSSTALEY